MHKIELVLPKAHQQTEISPGMRREMEDVQGQLDEHSNWFTKETIHFIISKGFYRSQANVLTIAGVIVNTTGKSINGLKMDLLFSLPAHPERTFPPMHALFEEDFLGVIHDHQAFILHFDVPAEKISDQDLVLEPNEIKGKLDNIEFQYLQNND